MYDEDRVELQLLEAESRAEADAVVVGPAVRDPAVDQPTALGDAAVAGSEQRGAKKTKKEWAKRRSGNVGRRPHPSQRQTFSGTGSRTRN